jgi:hypothetical protein
MGVAEKTTRHNHADRRNLKSNASQTCTLIFQNTARNVGLFFSVRNRHSQGDSDEITVLRIWLGSLLVMGLFEIEIASDSLSLPL